LEDFTHPDDAAAAAQLVRGGYCFVFQYWGIQFGFVCCFQMYFGCS
jgi:hypothetical protein